MAGLLVLEEGVGDIEDVVGEVGVGARAVRQLAIQGLFGKLLQEPRRRAESNRSEDKGGILAEYGLSDEQGNEIIMAARAHWFEDEAPAGDNEEAADAESSK